MNASPLSYPVPVGHLPYIPALLGAMGPLWNFPVEWWYYVGWAHDLSGSKHFTILVETLRLRHWPGEQTSAGVILYGIGITPNKRISSQCSVGYGFSAVPGENSGLVIPPPTPTSWSLATHADIPSTIKMTCMLTSGTLGLSGAIYSLDMTDVKHNVSASFVLKDTFGMILEGASGAMSNESYEFAMPCLNIEGGTITMDGVTTELGGGNLWLDRQCINQQSLYGQSISQCDKSREQHVKSLLAAHASSPLYIGNWVAVVMNKTVYVLVFFWPKKQDQWIVGSELDPPVRPTSKMGLEYPPLSDWKHQSPVQGVNVLDSSEFDLNILDPQDPTESPHWTSKSTRQTYCSAWRLSIRNQVYIMTVIVPGSEVRFTDKTMGFFEGAATISDKSGCQVGHAFVEQMGYTQ